MNTPDPKREFLDSLIGEEVGSANRSFEEYRKMLQGKLDLAERRFRFRHRATVGIWMMVGLLLLAAFAVPMIFGRAAAPIGVSLMILAYFLGMLGTLRLIMYVFVDRYRRDSVRDEVRDMTLLELTRKVEELTDLVDRVKKKISKI